MTDFEKENIATCRRIARELDAIAAGEVYRCPKCGEKYSEDTFNHEDENGNIQHICQCGAVVDDDEWENCQYSMYDYFDDALDVDYIIGSDGEYRGAVICIGCGGPHIDIDSRRHAALLYWGYDRAEWQFNSETADEIDAIFSEQYKCIRGR